MFREIFDEIQRKNPEIHLIGVWGKDGLELEKILYDRPDLDVELLGAELADVLGRMDRIRTIPDQYHLEYVSGPYKVIVFSLSAHYFLLIISHKELISKKLKFFLDLSRDNLLAYL